MNHLSGFFGVQLGDLSLQGQLRYINCKATEQANPVINVRDILQNAAEEF